METNGRNGRKWIKRAVIAIVATPCLWFVLAPFPGLGMAAEMVSVLAGHPSGVHGKHPSQYVGLWIKERAESPYTSALALLSDGTQPNFGMSQRVWHGDEATLTLDTWSMCGNAEQGTHWTVYKVNFDGPDRMCLTRTSGDLTPRWFRRIDADNELRTKLESEFRSDDFNTFQRAGYILGLIKYLDEHQR